MKAREILAAGVSTLFRADRLARTPLPAQWQRARLGLTGGAAAFVVFLNVVFEPMGLRLDQPSIPGWWFTGFTVAAVLLTLVHPLGAWRITAVLLALSPSVLKGLTDAWDWPWTPGMIFGAAAVLFCAGFSYRQVVVVWLFAYTAFAVWLPHLLPWQSVMTAVALAAGVLALGNATGARLVAEADRAEQQQRREAEEQRSATLEERAVIARELHDVVAHHMSVLALRAGSARYRFALPPELAAEFDEMQETAREGLTEMRRLLGVLRDENGRLETAPQPRVDEIAELVERLRGVGVAVSLHIEGTVRDVPAGVALSAYRIAQEALSNAVRHAPGSTVDVRVAASAQELALVVANSAATEPVPAPEDRPRHGLLGMRERVAALNGAVRAGPGERGGFVVAVTLPLTGNGA